jgi:hypothetical protein
VRDDPVARREPTGPPIVMPNKSGYSVEACPGCGKKPGPGEERLTVPGIWYVWHVACYDMSLL